jgi:hypothetical protein
VNLEDHLALIGGESGTCRGTGLPRRGADIGLQNPETLLPIAEASR